MYIHYNHVINFPKLHFQLLAVHLIFKINNYVCLHDHTCNACYDIKHDEILGKLRAYMYSIHVCTVVLKFWLHDHRSLIKCSHCGPQSKSLRLAWLQWFDTQTSGGSSDKLNRLETNPVRWKPSNKHQHYVDSLPGAYWISTRFNTRCQGLL